MLQRFKNEDEGFTLIELLVVILIIGILAAIALPSFLGQQKKGQDSAAKSDARNAVTQMESCFTDLQTYVGCPETSTPIASSVAIDAQDASTYTLHSTSKSTAVFTIAKDGNGNYKRTCTPTGQGGCPSDGNW